MTKDNCDIHGASVCTCEEVVDEDENEGTAVVNDAAV